MSTLYTYETFIPGKMLGQWEETLDPTFHARWDTLFGSHPSDAPARSSGLLVACMMRAYLGVVAPRPPGNIHARQILSLLDLPTDDERIRSQVWCRDKELRKERRYVSLEVIGTGHDERPLYKGQMNLIWAA